MDFDTLAGAAKALIKIGMKLYELSENFDSAKEQSGMVIARVDLLAKNLDNKLAKIKETKENAEKLSDANEEEKKLKKKMLDDCEDDEKNFENLAKYLNDRVEHLQAMLKKFDHENEKNFVLKKLKEMKNRFIDSKPFTELLDQIDKDLERISQSFQTNQTVEMAKALTLVLEETKHMNKTLEDMRDMAATAFTNETIASITEFQLQVWWYHNFKAEPIVIWKQFSIALETYMVNYLDENLREAKRLTQEIRNYFDTDGDGNVDVNELRIALGDDPSSKKQPIKFRTYVQEKMQIFVNQKK